MSEQQKIQNSAEYCEALNNLETFSEDCRKQVIDSIACYEKSQCECVQTAPSLSAILKNAMYRCDVSQSELASHLGSRGRVSGLLSGKRSPSLVEVKILRKILGLSADVLLDASESFYANEENNTFPKYPVTEMRKRGWISSAPREKGKVKVLIEELCRKVNFPNLSFQGVAFRQGVDTHFKSDKAAVHAWLLGVRLVAQDKLDSLQAYVDKKGEFVFLQDVVRLSKKRNGPVDVVQFLAQHGILLVVVPHLKRTHLDGGIFFMNGHPVIALTIRYDRLDAFWFTLLHELAHLIRGDVCSENEQFIVDDLDAPKLTEREQEANVLARESAIPQNVWDEYKAELESASTASMYGIAGALGIHHSIVAGRIRFERKDYRLLSRFVGNKMVRCLFSAEFAMTT